MAWSHSSNIPWWPLQHIVTKLLIHEMKWNSIIGDTICPLSNRAYQTMLSNAYMEVFAFLSSVISWWLTSCDLVKVVCLHYWDEYGWCLQCFFSYTQVDVVKGKSPTVKYHKNEIRSSYGLTIKADYQTVKVILRRFCKFWQIIAKINLLSYAWTQLYELV